MLPGIGIFGTGELFCTTLVPYLKNKGFRIEAIWGRTLEAAEKMANQLQIPFYTNKIDDVLLRKDVDLVFIICQPNLHAQIAVKALGIGKHVLCDRPAGLCQVEVLKMVHASRYYPSLISIISHSLRFQPAFIQMKKLIESNYIGEIKLCDVRVDCGSLIGTRFDWDCSQLMGGGVLTMIGSHIIDTIHFITGCKALRANGTLKTFTKRTDTINGIRWIDSDDFCTFQLILENDVFVTVTINSLMKNFKQVLNICGSHGQLIARDSTLYGVKSSTGVEELIYEDVNTSTSNTTDNCGSSSILPTLYSQGLFRLISALKEAFQCNDSEHGWLKEPVSSAATFEDGLYVQAVIDSIRQSSSTKEWENVNITNSEDDVNNHTLSRLNIRNMDQTALQNLSRSSMARIPITKKPTTESHFWNFSSKQHS